MSDNKLVPLRPFGRVSFYGGTLTVNLDAFPVGCQGPRRDFADIAEAVIALRDWCEDTFPHCKRKDGSR